MKAQKLAAYLEHYKNLVNSKLKEGEEKIIKEISLFSGIKQYNYWKQEIVTDTPAWFVEIWINGICVFREYEIAPNKDSVLEELQEELLEKVLFSIIYIGLTYGYKHQINQQENTSEIKVLKPKIEIIKG